MKPRRLAGLQALAERGDRGEQAAARRALASLRAKQVEQQPPPLEPGPVVTRKGGKPFRARLDDDGRAWVPVPTEADARAHVAILARLEVKINGTRGLVLAEDVEVDEDRGVAFVIGSLL